MRLLSRLVAAVALTAAASAVVPAAPALAAACPSTDGVTVVVDFHELGGGVQQACDANGGGKTASRLFPDTGFPLDYVQRQPGFVCRVSGVPADDPCVNTPPADAYWGLWWSDGESGTWSYSSTSAPSLTIPEGGYVAFSWNGSSTKSPPGAPATAHEDEQPASSQPQPSPQPGDGPGSSDPDGTSGTPGTTPTGGASSASAPTEQSESPSDRNADKNADTKGDRKPGSSKHHKKGDQDDPDETASGTPSTSASPTAAATAEPPAADEDGLPFWVAPVGIAALFAVAGVVALVRRRATP